MMGMDRSGGAGLGDQGGGDKHKSRKLGETCAAKWLGLEKVEDHPAGEGAEKT